MRMWGQEDIIGERKNGRTKNPENPEATYGFIMSSHRCYWIKAQPSSTLASPPYLTQPGAFQLHHTLTATRSVVQTRCALIGRLVAQTRIASVSANDPRRCWETLKWDYCSSFHFHFIRSDIVIEVSMLQIGLVGTLSSRFYLRNKVREAVLYCCSLHPLIFVLKC